VTSQPSPDQPESQSPQSPGETPDQPRNQPANQSADQPADQSSGLPLDQPPDRSTDGPRPNGFHRLSACLPNLTSKLLAHPAWAGVGGLAAVASVILAIIALDSPDSTGNKQAISPRPGASQPSSTGGSTGPTAPTAQSAAPRGSTNSRGFEPIYSDKVIDVQAPQYCGRTWVDIELGHSRFAKQEEPLVPEADIVHDGCHGALMLVRGGQALGIGPSGPVAPDECEEEARSRQFGNLPSEDLTTETVLCAISNTGVVAWIRVSYVGKPYADDGQGKPPRPTLSLTVTAWRKTA